MRRWLLRGMVVGLALGLVAGVGSAAARVSRSRALVVRLSFVRVSGAVGLPPSVDGRFVAIAKAGGVELIDERSGRSRFVATAGPSSGCDAAGLEGPWLVQDCVGAGGGHTERLYSLAAGTWRTVAVSSMCSEQGEWGMSGASKCDVGPVGSDWLGWTELCWSCRSYSGLVALSAGNPPLTQPPATGPRTTLDFNSPTLISGICSPLRDTPTNRLMIDSWGRFVSGASGGGDASLGRYAVAQDHGRAFLERCGSRLRRQLPGFPTTGNSSELLFYPSSGRMVSGLFLGSLRPFVVQLPKALVALPRGSSGVPAAGNVLLSSRSLYVLDQTGRLWRAAEPSPPKAH